MSLFFTGLEDAAPMLPELSGLVLSFAPDPHPQLIARQAHRAADPDHGQLTRRQHLKHLRSAETEHLRGLLGPEKHRRSQVHWSASRSDRCGHEMYLLE